MLNKTKMGTVKLDNPLMLPRCPNNELHSVVFSHITAQGNEQWYCRNDRIYLLVLYKEGDDG